MVLPTPEDSLQNQQPPQRGGAVPTRFGLGRDGCWPSRESQLPKAFPLNAKSFHSIVNKIYIVK